MRYLSLLMFCVVTAVAEGQISFSVASPEITTNFRSGVAIISTDINGDTYDDLVRFDRGSLMTVHLQGQDGQFLEVYNFDLGSDEQWNAVAGDLDNDGWADIVTSGAYDKVKVFRAFPFTDDFQRTVLAGSNFFAQGSNIVDIDNDGYADIFVCNDNGTNVIYHNDRMGGFDLAPGMIDFTTDPPSDNSGNYGSIWSDVDSDGDQDLFIAKCRQGVFDPADPRRINVLYLNTDTGYIEMADSFGLANGAQSWSPDFADFDNDGDFDLFLTNHDVPSQIFLNNDNDTLVDWTVNAGITVSGLPIQSVFHDFNNDGLVDLLVGGTESALFQNLGGGIFSAIANSLGSRDITSFALGDLNNDGFTDVYAAYHELFNSPSDSFDDAVWLNDGNDNNYLRVALRGVNCNASAVGSRITVYGEWGLQVREVRAGESYGITNSLVKSFGLGESEIVDSIVINWPHDLREVHENPPINTTITITEGGCLTQVVPLNQGPFIQCGSDTFELTAPDGFVGYLWSNGAATQEITVTLPGIYHVTLTDGSGCTTIGALIEVRRDEEAGNLDIVASSATTQCFGEAVLLTAPMGQAWQWNTDDTTEIIAVQESGEYQVTVTRSCGQVISKSISLSFLDPDNFETTGDTLFGPGAGSLSATGDSVVWYDSPEADTILGSGQVFITPAVDTTSTFYVENVSVIPGEPRRVGMREHQGNSFYNGDNFDGKMQFDVYNPVRVDSFLVMTDFAGERRVIIENQAGQTVFERTYQIDSGRHFLPVDHLLEPGPDYLIRTDTDVNNASFGTNSPQLYRSDGEVVYPYEVENLISIKSTSSSLDFYYYFYDWHLTTAESYCISERIPVQVVVIDTTTGIADLHQHGLRVSPNPTTDALTMEVLNGHFYGGSYMVITPFGRVVTRGLLSDNAVHIDLAQQPSGLYLIVLQNKQERGVVRIVKL